MSMHKCSICQCEFTEEEGGSEGYIGILPVSFCPTCLNGIYDMVEQTADPLELESLTDEEIQKALLTTLLRRASETLMDYTDMFYDVRTSHSFFTFIQYYCCYIANYIMS